MAKSIKTLKAMYPLSNLQPSPPDARDYVAKLPSVLPPQSVDLKPLVNEVEDQGTFSSCTANAGCSALELMYHKNNNIIDFSRFYLYYYTRQIGNIKGDGGAYPRDIGKALAAYGVCTESSWPYVSDNLDTEPVADVKVEAEKYKILSYEQLVGDKLALIKNALAQGVPVLLSMAVHKGFYTLTGNWKMHSWDYTTTSTNPILGWHEILIIGYDDLSQRLLVENSWGPMWGDGGFFGLPYDMITTPSFGELWVLLPNLDSKVVPNPVPTPEPKTYNIFQLMLFIIIVAAIIAAAVTM